VATGLPHESVQLAGIPHAQTLDFVSTHRVEDVEACAGGACQVTGCTRNALLADLVPELFGNLATEQKFRSAFENLLILGRVTSGRGGEVLVEKANASVITRNADTGIEGTLL